ncbi:NAD(P)-dependent oxidoreductase [Halobacillus litoralis]|uniref:NAD(P)-dependent oxidoreductase n=1 Tax=Halobacillus litoralis TaxID=45668 RepID=UPI001CFD7729|nr:NAD(P)-binding oxidoreductase [Halobacillus litoralis]
MNIVVFGSTGGTGKAFVEQALQAGHHVTAFARTPSKWTGTNENLEILQGDALNEADVKRAVKGKEAVVSCLGSEGLKSKDTLTRMTGNIVDAMKEYDVKRFLYVASAGIYKEIPGFTGWMSQIILKNVLEDHRKAVNLIMAADLDYTIARPMRLDHGDTTGTYRLSEAVPEGGKRINRSDVAHFLLQSLEKDQYVKQTAGMAY